MTRLHVDKASISLQDRLIIQGADFSIQSGEFVGLIGANGAGKTTLLRGMAHLVPLTTGKIEIDGKDVRRLGRRKLAQLMAYMPQSSEIDWPLDVYHVVALGRMPHRSAFAKLSAKDHEAVLTAMEQAHVSQYASRPVNSLSGGERARVMLARALAVGGPILLADEPTASLDPYHQLHLMELLQLVAASGKLVITVLHDLPLASRFCSRLIMLDNGRAISDGSPHHVMTPEVLGQAYEVRAHYSAHQSQDYVVPWSRLDNHEKDTSCQ